MTVSAFLAEKNTMSDEQNQFPSRERPRKSDKAVVWQRVREIMDLLDRAKTTRQIIQYGSEKGWGLTDRQIWKYIAKANKKRDQIFTETDKKKYLRERLNRREMMYRESVEDREFNTALSIEKDIATLLNLYNDERVEKIEAKLAELLRQADELAGRAGTQDREGEGSDPEGLADMGIPPRRPPLGKVPELPSGICPANPKSRPDGNADGDSGQPDDPSIQDAGEVGP